MTEAAPKIDLSVPGGILDLIQKKSRRYNKISNFGVIHESGEVLYHTSGEICHAQMMYLNNRDYHPPRIIDEYPEGRAFFWTGSRGRLSEVWPRILSGPESPYLRFTQKYMYPDQDFTAKYAYVFPSFLDTPITTLYNFCIATRQFWENQNIEILELYLDKLQDTRLAAFIWLSLMQTLDGHLKWRGFHHHPFVSDMAINLFGRFYYGIPRVSEELFRSFGECIAPFMHTAKKTFTTKDVSYEYSEFPFTFTSLEDAVSFLKSELPRFTKALEKLGEIE